MSNESRTLDVFGPHLLIESGGVVGVAGDTAYQLCSLNKSGYKYSQGLYGSGLAAINAEGTLQIESGIKNKDGANSLVAVAHKGDLSLTAGEGWVRIKGNDIVLDATNMLYLQGNKIKIGYDDQDRCQWIRMNAAEVDAGSPKSGTIGDLLKTSSMFQAMAGALVPQAGVAMKAAQISRGLFG